jgi:hypothetical protein
VGLKSPPGTRRQIHAQIGNAVPVSEAGAAAEGMENLRCGRPESALRGMINRHPRAAAGRETSRPRLPCACPSPSPTADPSSTSTEAGAPARGA